MKLSGKKALLANDYKEVAIRQKGKNIECRVSGYNNIKGGVKLGNFDKDLEQAETDSSKVSEILKYFVRYTKLQCIQEKRHNGINIIEFKGDDRRLTLSMNKDENVSATIKDIFKNYYYNLYNDCFKFIEEHDNCRIVIFDSLNKCYYKNRIVDIAEDDTYHDWYYYVKISDTSRNEYIINFIKLLIDNYNEEIWFTKNAGQLMLKVGQHDVVVFSSEEIIKYIYQHNQEIASRKHLQLKIEAI